MPNRKLIEQARVRHAQIAKEKKDPRYLRVMGKLIQAGLLTHATLPPTRKRVSLKDALWAGRLEPRILELIPAIVIKKPGLLVLPKELPADLKSIVAGIRHGHSTPDFRGIPSRSYRQWIPRIGHRNKYPSCTKTFRFSRHDRELLEELKKALPDHSEIAIIRKALHCLFRSANPTTGDASGDTDAPNTRRAPE
jgi:hypothetical protein